VNSPGPNDGRRDRGREGRPDRGGYRRDDRGRGEARRDDRPRRFERDDRDKPRRFEQRGEAPREGFRRDDRPREGFRRDDRQRDDRPRDDRPRDDRQRDDRPRDDRPRRFEDRDKPRRFERDDRDKPRRFEDRDKPRRFEDRDRPRRFEDRDKPRRFEDRDKPRRFEDRDRPRRFEDRDKPRRFEDRDRPRPFTRDDGDKPRRFERDDRDKPRRFEDRDRPRRFERDDRDKPRRFEDRDRPRRFEDRDRPVRRFERPDRIERERERAPRDSGPELPEDVVADDLDGEVRAELRSLAKPTAERVARHLVAAGRLVDEDPEQALSHATAARRLAPRIAAVREAVGVAAYHAGDWAATIAELRAYHRMTGKQTYLAVIADSERALGRPAKAIDIYRSADRSQLAPAEAVELLVVASGARRDLGQQEAAVAMLQVRELTQDAPWTARLRYAYADALLAIGRAEEAREWFARAVEADDDGTTDAAERLLELDGVTLEDEEEVEEEVEEEDEAPE
jgi:tetratricopeptide (TPR) repeat protein